MSTEHRIACLPCKRALDIGTSDGRALQAALYRADAPSVPIPWDDLGDPQSALVMTPRAIVEMDPEDFARMSNWLAGHAGHEPIVLLVEPQQLLTNGAGWETVPLWRDEETDP